MNKIWNRRGLIAAMLAAGVVAGCSSGPMSGMRSASHSQQVSLSGSNEVPPAATSASGSGSVTVNPGTHSVSVSIKVSGMTPTAAHIHEGAAGANGPVIVPLVKRGDYEFVSAEGAKLTDAQHEAMKAGKLYLNVHSAKFPGGELRAQLKGH